MSLKWYDDLEDMLDVHCYSGAHLPNAFMFRCIYNVMSHETRRPLGHI